MKQQIWSTVLSVLVACMTFSNALYAKDKVNAKAQAKTKSAKDANTPKAAIAHQMNLIKAGKLTALRSCLTKRQRKRVTMRVLKKAQREVKKYKLADLVHSVRYGKWKGQKTAKIKMKNGRTLTTMIWLHGKWLADTLWFR